MADNKKETELAYFLDELKKTDSFKITTNTTEYECSKNEFENINEWHLFAKKIGDPAFSFITNLDDEQIKTEAVFNNKKLSDLLSEGCEYEFV